MGKRSKFDRDALRLHLNATRQHWELSKEAAGIGYRSVEPEDDDYDASVPRLRLYWVANFTEVQSIEEFDSLTIIDAEANEFLKELLISIMHREFEPSSNGYNIATYLLLWKARDRENLRFLEGVFSLKGVKPFKAEIMLSLAEALEIPGGWATKEEVDKAIELGKQGKPSPL